MLVAALLRVDVELRPALAGFEASPQPELTVELRAAPTRPGAETAQPELQPVEVRVVERVGELVPPTVAPAGPGAGRDWHALAAASARKIIEEDYRREDIRESMWRQTRSTMFEGEGTVVAFAESPVLEDLPFHQAAGVLGLGVTLGSCFFGVPLAGIPVEERTVAITVLYCKG